MIGVRLSAPHLLYMHSVANGVDLRAFVVIAYLLRPDHAHPA